MRAALRFLGPLVLGLAGLTIVAGAVLERTTHRWFEKDIALRSQLAVTGARRALLRHWHEGGAHELQEVLEDITHDERIMAAAACDARMQLVARTSDFPARLSCALVGEHVLPPADESGGWREWTSTQSAAGGSIHVSAIPVVDRGDPIGTVVLVHDLSFVERREARSRWFLLIAFGFLSIAAAVVTVLAARVGRRGWVAELRRMLRGEEPRPEFQPILRDVRELVSRIVEDRNTEGEHGEWTAERLKAALGRHLRGEKVVIVANREPYIHQRRPDGSVEVLHPASGLVTALEPVMRACSGVWIAHGSGSADRETVDGAAHVRVPPGEESYLIRRVWLSAAEEKGYYYGFANEGLWPLCHVAHTRPLFRSDDWEHYRNVNQRFADAVVDEVDVDDPIVLVQDYHFALVPKMIRERLPHATVITFWHVPWPNSQHFAICPWRTELLDGLLGSSIVGFHTQFDCNNFLETVDRFLETRIDREQNAVVQRGRQTLVRAYPISLEWPARWSARVPDAATCRAEVFAQLGLGPDALLGVGVDRLDYTKGVEERLLAVECLLDRQPELRGRFTFAQLAAPSRTAIERYQRLNDSVEALAARINERFGTATYRPIALLRAHHEPPSVFRFFRAADLCYVSSLHDGMNLVAKEFVAARDDERGVLVLS
ncbi:MAG TPA: trehalose-6-phosphate synthase, partial [Planctomycetota bacterium]|nr:trehalose-6-phosphate synthase [Planctomycetota bacterium]